MLETIIDNAYEWLVVVNKDGMIDYMNRTYCEFLEVDREKVVGRHVTDVIENTRMHIVARSGNMELADLQYIRGNYMIANRVPIYQDDEIIGAVGTVIFRDTEQWKQMNTHIKVLLSELEYYRSGSSKENGASYSLYDIVGTSEPIRSLKEKVKQVASGNVSVLIRGESGTGKELFAHSIHQLSERSNRPFIKVNCGAIPDQLLESELFGYEEGAFTGAKKGGKLGKFELADKGTIFLDEIGDMPANMQVKLLRVLQDREVERVGSLRTKKVDVRIIAATNRPLEAMVEERRFREDLFYRINVIQLIIPALRERVQDVKPLAESFVRKISAKAGKRVIGIEDNAMQLLLQHNWPGNARELENALEASVHLTRTETVDVASLPDYLKENEGLVTGNRKLRDIVEKAESEAIRKTLIQCENDKLAAAKVLGIGKTSLYDKINKYDLF
ncbi:sigma 54-interacting transcriptional regulator [Alkalihalobacillus macyae]|uniref:sigma-54 interaction domain-containing protein n=1 Tax=Guptibacillus hwajinpoensis TaxID=208199 RepID=UPI00273A9A13|nr:sigma 54-interacting transcriptional regulator [Alkalihalobacillus macyae]MDP4551866.1 sigma 54-interacting transcriptional regulator [Alkalihalobacillus macyae]